MNVWIPKVKFYVLADEYGHSPESVSRRLREMEETGVIIKSYYDGRFSKGLVQYCFGGPKPKVPMYIVKEKVAVLNPLYNPEQARLKYKL